MGRKTPNFSLLRDFFDFCTCFSVLSETSKNVIPHDHGHRVTVTVTDTVTVTVTAVTVTVKVTVKVTKNWFILRNE